MDTTTSVKLNVRVVEDNRVDIVNFGSLYGKRIFQAAKIPCDLEMGTKQRKAQENNGISLTRTPFRYKVVAIDIIGLNLEKDIEGNPVIVINKGMHDANDNSIEIICPIDNSKFTKDVTTEVVAKALNSNDSSKVYFSSAKKLYEMLNQSNRNEMTRIEALIADLKKYQEAIDVTSQSNIDRVNDYYRQIDGKKTIDVNVHIDED